MNFNDFLCEKYFQKFIKNIKREKDFCENSDDFCDFGVTLIKRDFLIQRLPNDCLKCAENHFFGQRLVYNTSGASNASGSSLSSYSSTSEVIFVINCDFDSKPDLKSILIQFSKDLKKTFKKTLKFKTFFRISGKTKKYSNFWPNFDKNFSQTLKRNLLNAFKSNKSHSFDFLLELPRVTRPLARHVFLVECARGHEEDDSHVDAISARNHVL